ncbi:MAG: MBL fold metallo-hydrolase [Acidimicrobiales bacterium]|nr:MBL fold metallo-hydrolase [Acidimicrobiales bacterium]
MTVRTIETPSLGDRSYLVHDGASAFVVDPPRDIDRVVAAAAEDGVTIKSIFETHVHNDYVSGGLALSRRTGAYLVANADDDLSFDTYGVSDGDRIKVGELVVHVRRSPGHTHTHLSYVVEFDGEPRGVFTGGSLLYGTVGRTDLLGDSETDQLTRDQWSTVRSLVRDLPSGVAVYPTHGFGSFCSAQAGADRESGTIGDEQDNPAVATDDVDEFVETMLAGLSDYPAYYAHMGPLNRAGLAEPDLSPAARVNIAELERRIDAGEWVVDLRDRSAYAGRHLVGTLNFETSGLPTYLGWLMPWGSRLTLLAADPADIADAQRKLSLIGIDRSAASDLDSATESLPTGEYRIVGYDELKLIATAERSFKVIDVRRKDEYEAGHLDEAINIPLHELLDHLHHVPDGDLWVHCASGARASIAASVLARANFDVVLVNGGPNNQDD